MFIIYCYLFYLFDYVYYITFDFALLYLIYICSFFVYLLLYVIVVYYYYCFCCLRVIY